MENATLETLEEMIADIIKKLDLMSESSEADILEKAKKLAAIYREKSEADADIIKAEAQAEAERIKANAVMMEAEANVKDKKYRRIIDVSFGVAKILVYAGVTLVTFFVGIAFEDDHYLSSKVFAETRNKLVMKLGKD